MTGHGTRVFSSAAGEKDHPNVFFVPVSYNGAYQTVLLTESTEVQHDEQLSDARQIQVICIQDLGTGLMLRFVVRDSTMNVVHVENSNRYYHTQPESTA